MSEGIPYADIVIVALIAGFILLRLRSVLGTRNEDDPAAFTRILPKSTEREPVVQVDEKSLKLKREEPDAYLAGLNGGPIADALTQIKARDAQFSATTFLVGARLAFDMVFEAFAKGDRQTLKMLMSDAIFQEFSKEIDAREKEENKAETTLVSVAAKEITQATLDKNTARLSVRFESEQISIVRNPKGEIVEGNPSDVHHQEYRWTFERDVTSKNPNWKIIET